MEQIAITLACIVFVLYVIFRIIAGAKEALFSAAIYRIKLTDPASCSVCYLSEYDMDNSAFDYSDDSVQALTTDNYKTAETLLAFLADYGASIQYLKRGTRWRDL